MEANFWNAVARFEIERAGIDRRQFESCKEMHDLNMATKQVVADSRALIRRGGEMLSRDFRARCDN